MERRSIDWIHVRVGDEVVDISWDARQALIERLQGSPSGARLVGLFERHGPSSLVMPAVYELRLLRDIIWQWMEVVGRDHLRPAYRNCATRSSTASAKAKRTS
jgi:hypothetical protein